MRKSLSFFLLAVSPIAIGASAYANDDTHWYGGFDIGLSSMPSTTVINKSTNLSLESDDDRSFVGGLYIGKRFGKSRLELEYLVRKNDFGNFSTSNSFPGSAEFVTLGSQKNSSIMLNGWQSVVSGTDWSLLAGVGFGFSDLDLKNVNFRDELGQAIGPEQSANSLTPTMQAMVEFVHPMSEGMEFGLGYRVVRSARRTFETSLGEFTHRAKHNELFARISWSFGGGGYKRSAAPEPSPAPQPVAPLAPKPEPIAAPARPVQPTTPPVVAEPVPLPGPFIVYFAFDKSNISSEAMQIIMDAARAYRNFKAVEIQTSGHTDRAGADGYNERLAQRRVEAVRDALVREGVPASKILISAEGENRPAIATADGVREQQNRRVEITLIR